LPLFQAFASGSPSFQKWWLNRWDRPESLGAVKGRPAGSAIKREPSGFWSTTRLRVLALWQKEGEMEGQKGEGRREKGLRAVR
jgi:hypothetical protein